MDPFTPKTPVTVMVVDDHAIIRSGLKLLIETQPTLCLVGEAKNRAEALAQVASSSPDIILLDLDLREEDSPPLIPLLLDRSPNSRILILTGSSDLKEHQTAISQGAVGIVPKDKAPEVLFKAIKKVQSGEVWLDRVMMSQILQSLTQVKEGADEDETKIALLTDREREVVRLLCEGLKNQQIAERLYCSEATVRNHLTHIFSKLHVSDRLELVIYALRHRLGQLPR